MEDENSEIFSKVRSAIKAKLLELGVYADEELPGYIMVLAANKKTKDQMDDDLRLFLGNNTKRFTSWLHSVLQKLNAASAIGHKPTKKEDVVETKTIPLQTVEHKPKTEHKKKKKDKKEKKKKKNKEKKVKKERSESGKHKAAKSGKSKSPPVDNIKIHVLNELVSPPPHDQAVEKSVDKSLNFNEEIKQISSVIEQADEVFDSENLKDDVLDLRADTADLTFEFEEELPTKKHDDNVRPESKSNESNHLTSPRSVDEKSPCSVPKKLQPITDHPKLSLHERLGPSVSSSSNRRTINLREESSFPPKSKGDQQSIVRVVSNSIASAVRSVSLTHDNSENTGRKRLEARVRPIISSRVKRVSDDEEDAKSSQATRIVSTICAVKPLENQPKPGMASKVEVTPRPRRAGLMQANTALILRAVADAHKSVNRPVKRPLEEDDDEPSLKKEIFTRHFKERQKQRLGCEEPLTKKIAITVPNVVQRAADATVENSHFQLEVCDSDKMMEEEYEGPLERMDEISQMDVPVREIKRLKGRVVPMQMEESIKKDTRFIVTLDGLPSEGNDIKARLTGKAERVTPNSEDMDYIEEVEEWEEEEMENSDIYDATTPKESVKAPVTAVKKEERCRYWPECKEGDKCIYIHPNKPCMMFPKCRFGDKCIYIHPQCKFNASCTKPNCPFAHTSTRPRVPAPVSIIAPGKLPISKVKCRFFPKCTDMNCPFMHPKQVCHFGRYCRTVDCPYIHQDVVVGAKLRWVASKPSDMMGDSSVLTATSSS